MAKFLLPVRREPVSRTGRNPILDAVYVFMSQIEYLVLSWNKVSLVPPNLSLWGTSLPLLVTLPEGTKVKCLRSSGC